jgi:hypothetical protein
MDVFSLGVIIAELFIEKNIFTFPTMVNYKKGNKDLFDIEEYLKKINCELIFAWPSDNSIEWYNRNGFTNENEIMECILMDE